MLNAANRMFGSIDGNFDRSAGPIKGLPGFIGYTTREEIYSQHAIYMLYTFLSLWSESSRHVYIVGARPIGSISKIPSVQPYINLQSYQQCLYDTLHTIPYTERPSEYTKVQPVRR